jgi:adenosylmethionine-8-amino-7-oxononanoate aminotransferase
MNISASDFAVWHPFTQMKTAPKPLKVKRGTGVYLELEDGRFIIDCISSWWVNIHGHAHPIIAKAIYEQAKKLEHVIFAGFTHDPAEKLAKELLKYLPQSLSHVFYSDDGSTAVEVALKMACQYWHNQGQSRSRFIAFESGYHGDTLGSMSVGRSAPFWQPFRSIMFDVDIVPFPFTFENDLEIKEKEELSLAKLREFLEINPRTYAAIIIEPLIQGAGGMRICRPQFLYRLQLLAKEFDTLIIYDEVMTGFGRTGEWFASIKANTQPDIICLSKGITGGFLPLSATVVSTELFDKFYSDDIDKTFFHGHSYTANPLSCAAALASIELLEQNTDSFTGMELRHRKNAAKYFNLASKSNTISNLRFCGTVMAFDVGNTGGNDYFAKIGPRLKEEFLQHNLLIRPLGNTVYLMPPYCVTEEQLDEIYNVIAKVLAAVVPFSGDKL